jgi:hypothetical protein
MPALSFQGEWLDDLLSGSKQQTTRQQTNRIKVGDVCYIYNQQRRRITDKPQRKTTGGGCEFISGMIEDDGRYPRPALDRFSGYSLEFYHAHFLGKVVITKVYDLYPPDTPLDELGEWARADGFDTVEDADVWFTKQYGEEWDLMHWMVIRWDGWTELYFEPEEPHELL